MPTHALHHQLLLLKAHDLAAVPAMHDQGYIFRYADVRSIACKLQLLLMVMSTPLCLTG